jgi:hypothetical protein
MVYDWGISGASFVFDGCSVLSLAQGLNTLYVVFSGVCLILCGIHLYGMQIQWLSMNSTFAAELISGFASLPALHRTFTLGLVVFTNAILFEMLHLAVYVLNGFGSPMLNLFAIMMRLGCQLLIMFLLLLLASGWSISTESIENRVRIGMVFCTTAI